MTTKPSILSLTIRDRGALYAAFMPFIKNGGLFIPTPREYRLGDEVFLLLALVDNGEKLPIAGRVVWMTPKGAQSNRAAGVGVQFSDLDRGATRRQIEGLLAGSASSGRPTHTM